MQIINLTNDNFDDTINLDKLVLVDFWAAWCGPCKMLSPILEEVSNSIDNENIIIAKVNVDDEQSLAERFSVMTIPTLILFKKGEIIKQHVGVIQKDAILEMLK